MLHVQQRSVVSKLFCLDGPLDEVLCFVPVETFLTEPLIQKDRTPSVGCDAASFSVRSFLERCLNEKFCAEIGVDEGERGGKFSSAAIFLSSSLILYFTRR